MERKLETRSAAALQNHYSERQLCQRRCVVRMTGKCLLECAVAGIRVFLGLLAFIAYQAPAQPPLPRLPRRVRRTSMMTMVADLH
jgi:hypothetical protein